MFRRTLRLALCAISIAISACNAELPDGDPPDLLGTVSSALTSVVVEAEGATGPVTVETDPTASGNQRIAMTTSNTIASKTFTTTGSILSGTVRVRATQCSGPFGTAAPLAGIFVDGTAYFGRSVTIDIWTTFNLNAISLPPGTHTIGFQDRSTPPGCVIRFDQATFQVGAAPPPPLVVEAEGSTGPAVVETDPTASGGQRIAMTTSLGTASKSFTAAGPILSGSVRIRGTQCSTAPIAGITIDGVTRMASTSITSDAWTVYPLSVAGIAAGTHTIGFFDRSTPPGCVLRFDDATFVLGAPPPPPVIVEAEGSSGPYVLESDPTASGGQRIAMTTTMTTASKTFTTTGTVASATVRMRGTQCGVSPFATVLVDGAISLSTTVPTDTWTTYALNTTGLAAGTHTIGFQDRSTPTGCVLRFDQATFNLN